MCATRGPESNDSSPLRIGVVGCGNIAQIMHIPHLVDYEQFELVALADLHRPTLDAVGDRYRVGRRYTDWRELMAQDDIEAVVLCHSGSHRDTTLGALEAGRDVLVEKPVAWNLREVREVADRAAASDRIVQVGYHKRYDPGFWYARDQVRKMQDIGLVRITVLHPPDEMGHTPYRLRRGLGVIREGHVDPAPWDAQVQSALQGLAGGALTPLVDEALGERKNNRPLRVAYGMLTASVIHQIYTLFGFLGEPAGVRTTEIWRDGLSIHAVLSYDNGVRCTIDWHFLSHLKAYHEEYAFYGNHERVILRLPSPYLKNFPSPVIVQGGRGELFWEKKVIVSYEEAFRNELLAFYQNVRQRRQPETSVFEAVQHAEVIQKIIDAARLSEGPD